MATLKDPESIAISVLDRKLEEVKDKLILGPESTAPIFQRLLEQIQSKSDEITPGCRRDDSTVVNAAVVPETTDPRGSQIIPDGAANPMSQIGDILGTLIGGSGPQSMMGLIQEQISGIRQFEVKSEDILAWRTNSEMIALLSLDPSVRYMYLSPTALMPSLSGLYLHLTLETKAYYVLFTSRCSQPLIYSENILTREFVEKIFQEESSKIDPEIFHPMLRMMLMPQVNQYLNVDRYWTFVDPKRDPKPVRRRPVYVEDL